MIQKIKSAHAHIKPFIPTEEEIPNWLREFKGCEHHTDEEARDIYFSLGILAELLIKTHPVKIHNIDNQLVVSLTEQKNTNDNLKKAA